MFLPLLLLAYASGIVLAGQTTAVSMTFYWLVPGSALLWLALRRQPPLATILVLLLSFASGVLFYQLQRFPPPDPTHIVRFADGGSYIIDARIDAISLRTPGGYVLDLATAQLTTSEDAHEVHGRIRLYVDQGQTVLAPGDSIRFRGRLSRPRPFGTPGEFDLERYLAGRSIHATSFVPSLDDILLLRRTTPTLANFIERQRAATARFIDSCVPPPLAPLVRALTLGDKGGLSRETTQLLSRGGVSHLFAISGLHLGLIATALYAVALSFYRRSERLLLYMPPARLLPLGIAPLLIIYLFWTGAALSTQRALLMALALAGLILLRRRTAALHVLTFAAFAMLIADPAALFEPSFQLSFTAVAGLLLGYRRWHPRIATWPTAVRAIATLFLSTFSATLATIPLVLYHFHLLAPAGLITNLIAIPLIGWLAVPTALGGAVLWPFWPTGGQLLFQGCATIVAGMLTMVRSITALPAMAGWPVYTTTAIAIALGLLCLALFIDDGRHVLKLTLCAGAVLALSLSPRPPAGLSITALSVGQADAFLLSIAGQQILIDAGGPYGNRIDPGRQLIAPALGRLGVRTLDLIILTHNHPDHAKGLNTLLTDFPCRRLLMGEQPDPASGLPAVIAATGVPTTHLPHGWSRLIDADSATLAIYRPDDSADDNDRSLVVYARSGADGVLLTGDLTTHGVRQLLATPPSGPVTLLKLPHHGSRHSSPELLLDALHPRHAFVSLGAGNRFHFPHREVVAALEQRSIPLARTDRDGSFRFRATPTGWRFESLQPGFFVDIP